MKTTPETFPEDLTKIFRKLKRLGLSRRAACERIGISDRTVMDWQKRLRKPPAYVPENIMDRLENLSEELSQNISLPASACADSYAGS